MRTRSFLHTKKNNAGFITLIAVLIAIVVAVAVAIGILGTGISSGKIGDGVVAASRARGYANACAELALEAIRETGAGTAGAGDDTATGSADFTVDPDGADGSCSYSVTDGGNENRTVQATGIVNGVGGAGDYTRLAEIAVDDIDQTIHIDTWQEVAAF